MARSHGKILVGVWIDPDFTDLTPLEQWAYFMLLSQPKLNLVGCIDYQPARWAHHAANTSAEDIEAVLGGLEVAGFVCIDRDTEELLVRSMTKHDGLRTNNPKLMKGLWGAWTGIASPMLRAIAVDNMPDALFDFTGVPEAAVRLRRSARMDCAIPKAIGTESNGQSDAQSFRLPPSTTRHPTPANAQSDRQSRTQPPAGWFQEARGAVGA